MGVASREPCEVSNSTVGKPSRLHSLSLVLWIATAIDAVEPLRDTGVTVGASCAGAIGREIDAHRRASPACTGWRTGRGRLRRRPPPAVRSEPDPRSRRSPPAVAPRQPRRAGPLARSPRPAREGPERPSDAPTAGPPARRSTPASDVQTRQASRPEGLASHQPKRPLPRPMPTTTRDAHQQLPPARVQTCADPCAADPPCRRVRADRARSLRYRRAAASHVSDTRLRSAPPGSWGCRGVTRGLRR